MAQTSIQTCMKTMISVLVPGCSLGHLGWTNVFLMLVLPGFQQGRLGVFPFRKVLKTSPKLLQIHGFQWKSMNIKNFDFKRRWKLWHTQAYKQAWRLWLVFWRLAGCRLGYLGWKNVFVFFFKNASFTRISTGTFWSFPVSKSFEM